MGKKLSAAATDWQSSRSALPDLRAPASLVVDVVMLITTCPTCGRNPCSNPHFCALCRGTDAERARQCKPSDVLLKEDRPAASTVEALTLRLRERGTSALIEPKVIRRLSELSEQQLHEVCERLQRLEPHIAPAWKPEQVTILVDAWNLCHA
jgi:hypothetical protein